MTRFEELKENLTIDDLIGLSIENACVICPYKIDTHKCKLGIGCNDGMREYFNQEVKNEC